MSELEKSPEFTSNDVALAAGRQVLATAVGMAVEAIQKSDDPEVRADLESEFHTKLSESGVLTGVIPQPKASADTVVGVNGSRKPRTRDQVIMEASIIFWAKQRGRLPRPKKTISKDS